MTNIPTELLRTFVAVVDLRGFTKAAQALVATGRELLREQKLDEALVQFQPALVRLVIESAALFGAYFLALLFVMGQKPVYARLMRETGLWPAGSWSRTRN